MDIASFFVQALNGLASASSLFLVAAGLSLIFGVTRIVNFAHGSFFMGGVYVAYSLVSHAAPVMSSALGLLLSDAASATIAYFVLLLCAALVTGALGALVEVLVLRRIYKAPELFQLLATFALVLVMQDGTLWLWGAEDLLGPRAPGLSGAVDIWGRRFPTYDVFLIAIGPVVLAVLWWCLQRTRFGVWVRAATQDREMLGALGINPRHLFTSVFALGCALAGLGGVMWGLYQQNVVPQMGAQVNVLIFIVIIIGGLGSTGGALIGALLVGLMANYTGFLAPKLALFSNIALMAGILLWRPQGVYPVVNR